MEKNNIDDEIKKYEPMMHWLLKKYNIKVDYQDILQELRLTTWKTIISKNPKAMYLEIKNTKFSTYLCRALENRLKNILRTDYKKTFSKENKEDKYNIKKTINHNITNPDFIEELTVIQKLNAIKDENSADGIRLKLDLELFYETLDDLDKKIWDLNIQGWNHEEICKQLKQHNISKHRATISKRLAKINIKLRDFLKRGEL